jgi:phosphohistidine phosphatase
MTAICFVRHGIAGTAGPRWPDDRLRPLTPAGKVATRAAARGLARVLAADVVLTSPLVRARQTAEIVAKALGCRDLRETGALVTPDQRALLETIAATGAETVVAVGHEPDLSRAVSFCLSGDPDAIHVAMKKSAAALIQFEGSPTPGAGELQWFLAPRVLRAMANSR